MGYSCDTGIPVGLFESGNIDVVFDIMDAVVILVFSGDMFCNLCDLASFYIASPLQLWFYFMCIDCSVFIL